MNHAHDLLTRWPSLDVAERAGARLWRRDPSAWSGDPAVQQKIANRLGWLSAPALMADSLPRLQTFAASIKSRQFTDIGLLGMGGGRAPLRSRRPSRARGGAAGA